MTTLLEERTDRGGQGRLRTSSRESSALDNVSVTLCLALLAIIAVSLSPAPARASGLMEVWRGGTFVAPVVVSVNSTDGSCWVSDRDGDAVVHLAPDGSELWRGTAFDQPFGLSVNSADGSCWVADRLHNQVVHLAADGTELWRGSGFSAPWDVSANPADGSCWVAVRNSHEVVHLGEDGTELWRGGGYYRPESVSCNPADGSCWVGDRHNSQVVHLAFDGAELWRGGGFNLPAAVSVNPSDGSCWVADTSNGRVVHLAEDGTVLWSGDTFTYPSSVSVDTTTGACWVADFQGNQVVLLDSDGAELARASGFSGPWALCADSTDESCWVADTNNTQAVHVARSYDLQIDGTNGQVSVDGVSFALPYSGAFRSGQSVSLEAIPDATYEFSGWSGDLSTTDNPTVVITDDDKSITANFTKIEYTLSLTGTGLGAVFVDGVERRLPWSGTFDAGSDVALEAAPASCYEFADWSGDLSGTDNPTSIAMDGPKSVGANFTLMEYTLSLSGVGSGSVLVDGTPYSLPWSDTFACGSSVSVEAVPDTCWALHHWSGDVSGSENPLTLTVDGDKAVTANFAVPEYTLSLAGSGNGSVVVGGTPQSLPWSGSFACGSSVTVEAVPDEHREFTGWSGDLSGTENPTTLTMGGPKSVTANFGYVSYALSLSATGNGSISVDGVAHSLPWSGAFEYGSEVTLTAVPDDGWKFEGWNGAVAGTENPAILTIGGDSSVAAVFAELVTFPDVEPDHWAYDAINACVDAGIVSGFPDGLYRLDRPVDRASMAAYIARGVAGGEDSVPAGPEEPTFSDVPVDHWAYKHIEYVVASSIVTGYVNGTYQPTWTVTRAQMAVFVARAIVDPTGDEGLADYEPPATPSFLDVPADYWCYEYVEYLSQEEIISGYPDGLYRPTAEVTRDQMALYVARAFGLL